MFGGDQSIFSGFDDHLPPGGIQVNAGIDVNGNGILDPAEVNSTQYVCNGLNGVNGTNGINGTNGTNRADATRVESESLVKQEIPEDR